MREQSVTKKSQQGTYGRMWISADYLAAAEHGISGAESGVGAAAFYIQACQLE